MIGLPKLGLLHPYTDDCVGSFRYVNCTSLSTHSFSSSVFLGTMTSTPGGFEIPPSLLPYLLHEKTDDSTLQPLLLKVNIVFVIVVIFATSLRFTVRFRMLRSAGLDDSM
jgi:hypothetical protein